MNTKLKIEADAVGELLALDLYIYDELRRLFGAPPEEDIQEIEQFMEYKLYSSLQEYLE